MLEFDLLNPAAPSPSPSEAPSASTKPASLQEAVTALKKRRGRPPGAKNKPREEVIEVQTPKASRQKREAEVMQVPMFTNHQPLARTIELHPGLEVLVNQAGFYQSGKEQGVIAVTEVLGRDEEVRVPFETIKHLFRVQWVADMQADQPTILSSLYTVWADSRFLRVNQSQFDAMAQSLSKAVTRSYTYLDLADRKYGYTFNFPEFPSKVDQAEYKARYTTVVRRKTEEEKEIMNEQSESGSVGSEPVESDGTTADPVPEESMATDAC